jgi:pimeloyl-ACP methyl ester carboxylesterase
MHKRLIFGLLVVLFFSVAAAQQSGGVTGGSTPGVEEGFVQVDDGARIYYQIQGEGEPILLVHGYPLNGGLFRENVQALAEQYRVITVDLRGFGRSEAPNDQAVIPVYATDVLNVMEELGVEQAIIGGMSMGGPTILEMYQRAPERFTGMILIDTIAASASPAEKGLWRGVADLAQQNGVEALVPFLMKDMLSGDARMKRPELVEYYGNLMTQASLDAALGGANALATRPDYTDLLPQIEVPTLILVGLEDTVYPYEVSQMMQQAIPNAELVIIPGVAHGAIIEGAQAANQAILEWAAGLE